MTGRRAPAALDASGRGFFRQRAAASGAVRYRTANAGQCAALPKVNVEIYM